MAIKLTTTKAEAMQHGIKVLVHGPAGAGKTVLCSTTDEPTVIISAEAGLLSLRHTDIPVIKVESFEDAKEAYELVAGEQGEQFSWVCLDSITEIAEQVLHYELGETGHAMKAYGEMTMQMMELLRLFRDLPGKNVYMSAKQERITDEADNRILYGPMMPGKKLAQQIPFLFDEVFSLRVQRDPDSGGLQRWLQTARDIQHEAKDRSGILDMMEPPSLSTIAGKIRAGIQTTNQE